jgi:hypothetical protein
MSVTSSNLVEGPAVLYYGAYGATEPADSAVNSAPATSAWTDLGGTNEGLTLSIDREMSEMTVDQVLYVVATQPTKIDPKIKTTLAEATLANLAIVLNEGTVATPGSYRTFDPPTTEASFQATYYALIVDGWAPGTAKRRRVIARKCLSIESVEAAYKKDGQFVFPATWRIHYIDSSTKPFHIVDAI